MYIHVYMYMYMYSVWSIECRGFESHPRQLIFSRKSDCLGCAALLCLVCLFDLALSFFLLISHLKTCTVLHVYEEKLSCRDIITQCYNYTRIFTITSCCGEYILFFSSPPFPLPPSPSPLPPSTNTHTGPGLSRQGADCQ